MDIWLNYLDQILIYATLALSLNLLLGYAGQVSVAHAAFAAFGGYAFGYFQQQYSWNFLPGIAVGVIIAFVVGTVVALPAMKLSVEYLILLTLAVGSVIIGFFTTIPSLGGTYGLVPLKNVDLFGWNIDRPRDWVPILAVFLAIVYLLCRRMGESPFGRVLKALREDPMAAQSLGKNVFAYKLGVFGITAGLAALGGGLYSAWLTQATPVSFGFNFSLTIFAIVIFGGMANLTGSVVAGGLVLIEPILKRLLSGDATRAAVLQLILYGLALAVLMRVRPQGVLPEGFSLWRRLRGDRQQADRVEMAEDWVPTVTVGNTGDAGDLTVAAEHQRELEAHRRWEQAPVVLEARGLSKRFGGIIAADGLDLDLRRGTITALVGPNGAGKTTVFNLLTGFIPPDSGSVKLNGRELVGATPDKVARAGMVRSWQDVRLFNRLTCLQNVALGVQQQPGENLGTLFLKGSATSTGESATMEKALEWLRFVGMGEFADLPAGAVSYGQSKLISLARVLATEAEVLLLDEPASGIDTKWVDTMLDLVEAVREQGRTVCIVEHNLHVVGRLADHTYFMELGQVTAQGTIEELTSSPRLADAYFGTSAAPTAGAR